MSIQAIHQKLPQIEILQKISSEWALSFQEFRLEQYNADFYAKEVQSTFNLIDSYPLSVQINTLSDLLNKTNKSVKKLINQEYSETNNYQKRMIVIFQSIVETLQSNLFETQEINISNDIKKKTDRLINLEKNIHFDQINEIVSYLLSTGQIDFASIWIDKLWANEERNISYLNLQNVILTKNYSAINFLLDKFYNWNNKSLLINIFKNVPLSDELLLKIFEKTQKLDSISHAELIDQIIKRDFPASKTIFILKTFFDDFNSNVNLYNYLTKKISLKEIKIKDVEIAPFFFMKELIKNSDQNTVKDLMLLSSEKIITKEQLDSLNFDIISSFNLNINQSIVENNKNIELLLFVMSSSSIEKHTQILNKLKDFITYLPNNSESETKIKGIFFNVDSKSFFKILKQLPIDFQTELCNLALQNNNFIYLEKLLLSSDLSIDDTIKENIFNIVYDRLKEGRSDELEMNECVNFAKLVLQFNKIEDFWRNFTTCFHKIPQSISIILDTISNSLMTSSFSQNKIILNFSLEDNFILNNAQILMNQHKINSKDYYFKSYCINAIKSICKALDHKLDNNTNEKGQKINDILEIKDYDIGFKITKPSGFKFNFWSKDENNEKNVIQAIIDPSTHSVKVFFEGDNIEQTKKNKKTQNTFNEYSANAQTDLESLQEFLSNQSEKPFNLEVKIKSENLMLNYVNFVTLVGQNQKHMDFEDQHFLQNNFSSYLMESLLIYSKAIGKYEMMVKMSESRENNLKKLLINSHQNIAPDSYKDKIDTECLKQIDLLEKNLVLVQENLFSHFGEDSLRQMRIRTNFYSEKYNGSISENNSLTPKIKN